MKLNRWVYLLLCIILFIAYVPMTLKGAPEPHWLVREAYCVILAIITIPRLKKVGTDTRQAFIMLLPFVNVIMAIKLIVTKDNN